MATLAVIGMAAGAAGSIVGGIGKGNADQYQAAVASNNQTISQQNARYAAGATAVRTEDASLKAASQLARVRTGIAANGIDVNSGSPADVQTSQRELGSLDTSTVANEGALKVYGYKTDAENYQAQANIDRASAPYDYAGGFLKAGASLLSTSPENPLYDWMKKGSSFGTPISGDAGSDTAAFV